MQAWYAMHIFFSSSAIQQAFLFHKTFAIFFYIIFHTSFYKLFLNLCSTKHWDTLNSFKGQVFTIVNEDKATEHFSCMPKIVLHPHFCWFWR